MIALLLNCLNQIYNFFQLLILVQSNPPSSSGPNIASEVIDYLDFGLEIIAIGVGEGGNKNLDNIAIKKNFVIKVKSFTELSAKGAFLIQNALLPAVGYVYTKGERKSKDF